MQVELTQDKPPSKQTIPTHRSWDGAQSTSGPVSAAGSAETFVAKESMTLLSHTYPQTTSVEKIPIPVYHCDDDLHPDLTGASHVKQHLDKDVIGSQSQTHTATHPNECPMVTENHLQLPGQCDVEKNIGEQDGDDTRISPTNSAHTSWNALPHSDTNSHSENRNRCVHN